MPAQLGGEGVQAHRAPKKRLHRSEKPTPSHWEPGLGRHRWARSQETPRVQPEGPRHVRRTEGRCSFKFSLYPGHIQRGSRWKGIKVQEKGSAKLSSALSSNPCLCSALCSRRCTRGRQRPGCVSRKPLSPLPGSLLSALWQQFHLLLKLPGFPFPQLALAPGPIFLWAQAWWRCPAAADPALGHLSGPCWALSNTNACLKCSLLETPAVALVSLVGQTNFNVFFLQITLSNRSRKSTYF